MPRIRYASLPWLGSALLLIVTASLQPALVVATSLCALGVVCAGVGLRDWSATEPDAGPALDPGLQRALEGMSGRGAPDSWVRRAWARRRARERSISGRSPCLRLRSDRLHASTARPARRIAAPREGSA